jgi:hypothetical protein
MAKDAKREPVSMGIIVNFTTRTVQGFGAPGLLDYPVKVDVQASETNANTKASKFTAATNYALKCRPTQRMF